MKTKPTFFFAFLILLMIVSALCLTFNASAKGKKHKKLSPPLAAKKIYNFPVTPINVVPQNPSHPAGISSCGDDACKEGEVSLTASSNGKYIRNWQFRAFAVNDLCKKQDRWLWIGNDKTDKKMTVKKNGKLNYYESQNADSFIKVKAKTAKNKSNIKGWFSMKFFVPEANAVCESGVVKFKAKI